MLLIPWFQGSRIMQDVFNIIAVVAAILMIVMILAQNRGTGLGEAFGGDSSFHFTRRGIELVMHQLTILFAIVFALSIVLGIMSA